MKYNRLEMPERIVTQHDDGSVTVEYGPFVRESQFSDHRLTMPATPLGFLLTRVESLWACKGHLFWWRSYWVHKYFYGTQEHGKIAAPTAL